MKAIVLAGGGGTRLWPLSKEDFPKQFLNFGSGLSLLQKTVQRLLNASFIDEIVVATNTHHLSLVQEQLQKIDSNHKVKMLIEPFRKNTAPAIGLALKYLEECSPCNLLDPILVLPSDHLIDPEAVFLHALEQMDASARGKWMITFGIRPVKPETGYGYIQIGQKHDALTFEAARFVEKPDLQAAEKYLKDPRFYWNSGMFLFSVKTFWSQLQENAPDLFALMTGSYADVLGRFSQMPDISIDYAIMEKSKNILVCPLAVSWSDVGSWDSVYEAMEKDKNQNVKVGQVVAIDTTNSLIIGGKRIISTIGLKDLLIIETDEAVLISKRGESQRVKILLQELKQRTFK